MPIVSMIPNAEMSFQVLVPAVYHVVGSGSSVAALSDGASGSYIEIATNGSADDRLFSFGSAPTISASQRISAIRLRMNVLKYQLSRQSTNADALLTMWTYTALGDPGTNNTGFAADGGGHYYPTVGTVVGPLIQGVYDPNGFGQGATAGTLPRLVANWQEMDTTLNVPGIYYSPWWSADVTGRFWDAAAIGALRLLITNRAPDGNFYFGNIDFQLADAAIDIDVRNQPTVQVFQSVGSTLGASVQWQSTMNDSDVQTAWEMAIFTQAQTTAAGFNASSTPAVFRTSGQGAAQGSFVPVVLTTGATYVAYVRVAKTLGTTYPLDGKPAPAQISGSPWTQLFWSNWASNSLFVTPVDTNVFTPSLPLEGVLGCHDWRILVQTRGGGKIIAEIPWAQAQWGRRLQDVSDGSATFPRGARFMPDIKPWVHELAFWRDGPSGEDVLEWVGPVTGLSADRDNVTVRARDWWTLFEHRRVHTKIELYATELATVYAWVALDALGFDNSANLGIVIHATGVLGDKLILAEQYRRTADVLRELGRAGVEWTMLGRQILAGGVEFGIPALRTLLDAHCVTVQGDTTGEAASTDVTVVGRATNNQQVVANQATPNDPRGLLETVISTSDVQDPVSALVYAASALTLAAGLAPRTFQATLDDQAQNGFQRLIPGARVPVDWPTLGIRETLRLRQVDVSIQRSPDGQTSEGVTVNLSSLGSTLSSGF